MKLSGGAVAHIGIALMLIGIIFSSGYSSIISKNTSGRIYSRQFSEELNQNNVLLWLDEPLNMNNYELTYKGTKIEPVGLAGYLDYNKLFLLHDKRRAIVLDTIQHRNRVMLPGDTVEVYGENTYYEVVFRRANGKAFTLYPRAQVNPSMGMIASPDVKKFFGRDLYTHVSSIPDPDLEREWGEMEQHKLKPGDQFVVSDFIAELVSVGIRDNVTRVSLRHGDVAVGAKIKILGKAKDFVAEPVFFIKNNSPGIIPHYLPELGARFSFLNIDTENNVFTIGVESTQRDYIILKAMEKPHINVLWIGTIVVLIGFGIATYRRAKEVRGRNIEKSWVSE